MAESRSSAPSPLDAGTADGAVGELDGGKINARLRKHLLLCQASTPQPRQRMLSAVFLDALVRYPLPVVSAATAQDIAGSGWQWQLRQQSAHSPSMPPSHVPGTPTLATPRLSARTRRSAASLRGEGRVSVGDSSQLAAAAELTAAIHHFWAQSSSATSTPPPHPPLLTAIEDESQSSLRTAAASAPGPAPPPPPPPWAAFSPFRFCADPSFHAALRCITGCRSHTGSDRDLSRPVSPRSRPSHHMNDLLSFSFPAGGGRPSGCPGEESRHCKPGSGTAAAAVHASASDGGSTSLDAVLGAPWTVIDALCHGFAAAAVDGGHGRKRGRTETDTAALAARANLITSAHCRVTGPRDSGNEMLNSKRSSPPAVATGAAQAALRTNPSSDSIAPRLLPASPVTAYEAKDALQSRVAENDDLLGLLLGGEESTKRPLAFAGGLLCARGRLAETAGKADAEPCRNREDGQIALPERDCAATPFRVGTGSRPGALEVRVDVDGPPAPSAQNSYLTPALALTASARTAFMRTGPAVDVGAEAGSSTCGGADGCEGERLCVASVKVLRDMCTQLGLLSTGSKATLQQRLRLYYASAPPPQGSGVGCPLVAAASDASFSPPVSLEPGTMRLGSGAGASRAAGSLPRTVFRYHSPSQSSDPILLASASVVAPDQPRRCTGEAVGEPATRTAAATGREHTAALAPPTGVAPGQRGRLVPSPTEFLHDLASRKPQTPSVALATLCDPYAPFSAAAVRAQQEELTSEAGRVRWQWLVDFRERASAHRGGGSGRRHHEGMLEAFRKQRVPCASVMLPAGDFMLSVELSPEEAAAVNVCGVAATTGVDDGMPSASTAAEDAVPVLSHVCSLVVERKTAADLDASVKGARYAEQRRLLAASPFRLVVWLIEGTEVAGGRGGGGFTRGGQRCRHGGGGAEGDAQPSSRSLSPSSPSPAESARQRVDSACASLGLQGKGWLVVRTRSTAESVQFLKLLATHVTQQLASYRLRCRCRSKGESAVVPDADCCVALKGAVQHSPAQHLARTDGGNTCFGGCSYYSSGRDASTARMPAAMALLELIPTETCLQSVSALQRRLRAKTAFPRMLMCVRGCSAALASLIAAKHGTLLRFWRELRQRGQEACDTDPDIQRLSTAQKKVYVLLTEFLLAKDYF
ncbi:hypothetical protein LSCM1_05109 [Leishmania martiniquensis]|uniref:Crossover junction endonuclease MUS81 n=1 Tax=Leishmania martiniquensis TaxID=1580590 RepID=A0A836HJG5_9TRYP|nr:hypothetical protein LSCM1_05109 [Leishmania martiniquensis]